MDAQVGNKFRFGEKIGGGSSGKIYKGTDIQTNEEVAIKLEDRTTDHPKIQRESKLYEILVGGTGIPHVRWFGVESDYNVLVMDLLGPSLEDLVNQCGGKLSLKSVLMLAHQMIKRLEYVHRKSLLHRNIKPKNFLMGMGRHANKVYIIGFSHGKKFIDTNTHQHISYRENKSLKRTGRYASKNAHHGREQGRRDDLESLGYVLMYLLRGSLPWEDLKGGTKRQKYEKISEKLSMSIEALCYGYPIEFASYFHYCCSLRFDDEPDYAYLRKIFRSLFNREGFQYDYIFDWTTPKYQQCQCSKELAHVIYRSLIHVRPSSSRGEQSEKKSMIISLVGHVSLIHVRPSSSRVHGSYSRCSISFISTSVRCLSPLNPTDLSCLRASSPRKRV
ncbi:unnamed protein product [Spirodela intermedia]|uniref:Protein kinase domain-containing protein n=1 Tax=Spirodela intermedia TaxID=51605 RepID=A0A7I8LG09_SPIIN|nr:unnamed protein product [Spirodela intermedia]